MQNTGADGTSPNRLNTSEDVDKSRAEATFQFTVVDFSNFTKGKDVNSPEHYVRYIPWYLNISRGKKDDATLDVFLYCNCGSGCFGWTCFTRVKLSILPKRHGVELISRQFETIYGGKDTRVKETDTWNRGYGKFARIDFLLNPDSGYIENDTITFEVHIETDFLYGVFCDPWDSKLHTGYVGLRSQVDTCWMNCFLQILFFTTKLRKAVCKIRTCSDDSTTSLPLVLQRIFHDLQYRQRTVDAKDLTTLECFQPAIFKENNNCRKFMKILLEEIENRMKCSNLKETIPSLFMGRMTSLITCENDSGTMSHVINEIQLEIKKIGNINGSFERYVSSFPYSGHTKYLRSEFELRNAEVRVVFNSLPPILHLYLERFEYNSSSEKYIKNNDKFEFYEKLSLDAYLCNPDPSDPANYTLQAVLVHQGEDIKGKYVAFIDPKADGQWYKFDDENACRCTKEEAIEGNYGEENNTACMLVYIRDSELSDILQDQADDDEQGGLLRVKKNKLIKDNEHLSRQNEELTKRNGVLENSRLKVMEEAEAYMLEIALLRQRIAQLENAEKKS